MNHSEKALSLDSTNSLALTVNGIVNANLLGNYSRAETSYSDALQADPNNSLAWLYSAALASFQGDGSHAWEHAQLALKLSPIDPQKYLYQKKPALAFRKNISTKRNPLWPIYFSTAPTKKVVALPQKF